MAMVSRYKSFRVLLAAFGAALVASLALSAAGVTAASAATQHWYVGGPKLAEGVPTGVTMKNTTGFTLKWKSGGINFTVSCSSENGEGTIENPVGGGAGIAYMESFTLSGCTVTAPKTCKVKGGQIATSLSGKATEFEAKPAVEFGPWGWESPLFVVTIEECGLSGYYNFYGSFTGIAPTAKSIEFTEASSAITFGGVKATLAGTSRLQTTTEQSVMLKP
jgi:hypothetical protein